MLKAQPSRHSFLGPKDLKHNIKWTESLHFPSVPWSLCEESSAFLLFYPPPHPIPFPLPLPFILFKEPKLSIKQNLFVCTGNTSSICVLVLLLSCFNSLISNKAKSECIHFFPKVCQVLHSVEKSQVQEEMLDSNQTSCWTLSLNTLETNPKPQWAWVCHAWVVSSSARAFLPAATLGDMIFPLRSVSFQPLCLLDSHVSTGRHHSTRASIPYVDADFWTNTV